MVYSVRGIERERPMALSLKSVTYFLPVAALAALIVILDTLSPLGFGPAGILLVLAVIYVLVDSTLLLIINLIALLLKRLGISNPHLDLEKRKTTAICAIISGGPIALLALNSLGQLEVKDFVLVVLLISLACFYVIRQAGSEEYKRL